MRRRIIFILVSLIVLLFFYNTLNYKNVFNAKRQKVKNCNTCLVKNEETAVQLAEILLFQVYGEDKIKSQRPYEVKLVKNNIWIITGSLNENIFQKLLYGNFPKFGGTFEVKIDAKNAQVIYITHYK